MYSGNTCLFLFLFSNNDTSTVASGKIQGGIIGIGSVGTTFNGSILNCTALWFAVHPKLFVSLLSFSQHGFKVLCVG